MEFKHILRGFALIEFQDAYDKQCSLQKSSLATDDAIWLGINDPEPKVMASQAALVGVQTTANSGWVAYPIPPQVSLNTRMHLTRDQIADLLPLLQHFVATGDLPESLEQPAQAVQDDVCAQMRALCSACGGTGDVHTLTGEWRGECNCEASQWVRDARDARRYRFLRNEAWGGGMMKYKFPHAVEYRDGMRPYGITELAEEALDAGVDAGIAAIAAMAGKGE